MARRGAPSRPRNPRARSRLCSPVRTLSSSRILPSRSIGIDARLSVQACSEAFGLFVPPSYEAQSVSILLMGFLLLTLPSESLSPSRLQGFFFRRYHSPKDRLDSHFTS